MDAAKPAPRQAQLASGHRQTALRWCPARSRAYSPIFLVGGFGIARLAEGTRTESTSVVDKAIGLIACSDFYTEV
jgi:hypothetical protein